MKEGKGRKGGKRWKEKWEEERINKVVELNGEEAQGKTERIKKKVRK